MNDRFPCNPRLPQTRTRRANGFPKRSAIAIASAFVVGKHPRSLQCSAPLNSTPRLAPPPCRRAPFRVLIGDVCRILGSEHEYGSFLPVGAQQQQLDVKRTDSVFSSVAKRVVLAERHGRVRVLDLALLRST